MRNTDYFYILTLKMRNAACSTVPLSIFLSFSSSQLSTKSRLESSMYIERLETDIFYSTECVTGN